MIVVMTKFPINQEYLETFEQYALERFGEKGLKEQEGFIKMNLLKPENFHPNSKNNMFIIETYWKDMESLKKYMESDAFRKAHENPPPREWFAGHPVVEVYTVIKEG